MSETLLSRRHLTDGNEFTGLGDTLSYVYLFLSIFLVVCAGLASGLTMGLMNLDRMKLQTKIISGTKQQKRDAEMLLPLVEPDHHHYLLVTLLLFNATAAESLPIVLGKLIPDYIAVIISIFVVLVFGEILPASYFTGPHQMYVLARFTLIIYFLELLLFPLSYPFSILLDYYFGINDKENLSSEDISAALQLLLRNHGSDDHDNGGGIGGSTTAPPERHNQDNDSSYGALDDPTDSLLSTASSLFQCIESGTLSNETVVNRALKLSYNDLNLLRNFMSMADKRCKDHTVTLESLKCIDDDQVLTKTFIEELMVKEGFTNSIFPVLRSGVIVGSISAERLLFHSKDFEKNSIRAMSIMNKEVKVATYNSSLLSVVSDISKSPFVVLTDDVDDLQAMIADSTVVKRVNIKGVILSEFILELLSPKVSTSASEILSNLRSDGVSRVVGSKGLIAK